MARKNPGNCNADDPRKLVDHEDWQLSVTRQCELPGLPCSMLVYKPIPIRESTLRIMARIDALYFVDLACESRRMVDYLANEGILISHDRVRNLMHRMGLRGIYQKPRTTIQGEPARHFPCLVDLNQITTVDQVWATDITFIPLRKGFLYLVAVNNLFSRHILDWKLSNVLDTEFCLEALEMAFTVGRKPEILHSDQGSQFTSSDFVERLQTDKIKISWSGRRRCFDNILVERLWCTLTYEEVCLWAYSDGLEVELRLAKFLWRYSHVRPHSPLGGKTPYYIYTGKDLVPPVQRQRNQRPNFQ